MEFIYGVAVSLFATLLWKLYDKYIANRPINGLLGVWVEEIPTSLGRMYSIGEIVWDRRNSKYRFDGINYSNNGKPFCKWESISVEVDVSTRKLFYTFKASVIGELNMENYGFGVLNLQENNGLLFPVDGHYIEAKQNGLSHSHTMRRKNDVISQLNFKNEYSSLDEFYSELVNAMHLASGQNTVVDNA